MGVAGFQKATILSKVSSRVGISTSCTERIHRKQQICTADLLAEMFGEETARDRSTTNPHNRKLRAMIEEINNQGGLICSSSYHGYWWAKDLNDGMASVNENKARAMTQLGNVTKLEKNIAQAFTHQYGMNI